MITLCTLAGHYRRVWSFRWQSSRHRCRHWVESQRLLRDQPWRLFCSSQFYNLDVARIVGLPRSGRSIKHLFEVCLQQVSNGKCINFNHILYFFTFHVLYFQVPRRSVQKNGHLCQKGIIYSINCPVPFTIKAPWEYAHLTSHIRMPKSSTMARKLKPCSIRCSSCCCCILLWFLDS